MVFCGGIWQSISQADYDLPFKTKVIFIWFGEKRRDLLLCIQELVIILLSWYIPV